MVLGNLEGPAEGRTRAVLRRSLASDSPLVRGHAVWAAHRRAADDLITSAARTARFHADDPEGIVAAELELAGVETW